MFLITTSDQRFWRTDEKILFLGEWCRLYSQKHIWSKLDHQVLPYHWNDRKKLYEDSLYLNSIYEGCLKNLSSRLNKLHGVNYSPRYWRILLGPWLLSFIPIFYDAYFSIKTVVDSELATNTCLSNTTVGKFLSDSTKTSFSWAKNNEGYRHYLYSWIFNKISKINNFEMPENQHPPHLFEDIEYLLVSKLIKRAINNLLAGAAKFVPNGWNKLVIVNGYLPLWDAIKLQVSLRQFPILFYKQIPTQSLSIDSGMRKKLNLGSSENQFQSFLFEIIPDQLPTVFVEGYEAMQKKSLAAFPSKPKAIFSGVEIYTNEGFKFWAAHQAEQGVNLLGSQHGGGYGCLRILWCEEHEKKVYDKFSTWGWDETDNSTAKAMSSPWLSRSIKKIKPNPAGGILWVGIAFVSRYVYEMASNCLSSQVLDNIEDQRRFANVILPEVYNMLFVRLYPADSGWEEGKRWAENNPSLKFYRGSKPLIKQVNEFRLSIHTYNSTSWLETFSANYPTILFWNPNHWDIRKSAEPYYSELRRVGILHDTPESAATKVNEIYADPMIWWMSDEVQDVRKYFCHRYARTSENWQAEWKEELLKLTND